MSEGSCFALSDNEASAIRRARLEPGRDIAIAFGPTIQRLLSTL